MAFCLYLYVIIYMIISISLSSSVQKYQLYLSNNSPYLLTMINSSCHLGSIQSKRQQNIPPTEVSQVHFLPSESNLINCWILYEAKKNQSYLSIFLQSTTLTGNPNNHQQHTSYKLIKQWSYNPSLDYIQKHNQKQKTQFIIPFKEQKYNARIILQTHSEITTINNNSSSTAICRLNVNFTINELVQFKNFNNPTTTQRLIIGGYYVIDSGTSTLQNYHFNTRLRSSPAGWVDLTSNNGQWQQWVWYYVGQRQYFWKSKLFSTYLTPLSINGKRLVKQPTQKQIWTQFNQGNNWDYWYSPQTQVYLSSNPQNQIWTSYWMLQWERWKQ